MIESEQRAPLFRLDLVSISAGFGLTPAEAIIILHNGRALAPFLEVLGRNKLGFPPRRSTEVEDEYLVVVMRDDVNFASSSSKGIGRKAADIAVLTERIKNFHGIGVVDAHRMPFLAFYEVNPANLAKYLFKNNQKSGSMSRDTFLSSFGYGWDNEEFRKYYNNSGNIEISRDY